MRFKSPAYLDDIRDVTPAVFANEPHPNMMGQYAFVPTHKIIAALLDDGYAISRADQQRTKEQYSAEAGKHIICLRKREHFHAEVGDVIPEVVFTGSHDGSSAMHLYSGLYRLICSNGLITGSHYAHERILHRPGAEEKVLQAARDITEALPGLRARIQRMTEVELPYEAQASFAARAAVLRWPSMTDTAATQFLLHIRRQADAGSNLWRVMNRIQENLLKGGYNILASTGSRNIKVKELESVARDVSINRGLWTLAEGFIPSEQM